MCPVFKEEVKPIELGPVSVDERPESEKGWRRVKVTYDTGAGASVANKGAFPFKVRPSEAQKKGIHYVDAGGNKIGNEGEMEVQGETEEFQRRQVVFQMAEVVKPLYCSTESIPAGFRTVLDDEASGGCYMEHKATGEKTKLEVEDGVLVFYLWVWEGDEEEPAAENDTKEVSGFTRPGQP